MQQFSFKVTLRATVDARDAPSAINLVRQCFGLQMIIAGPTVVEISEVHLGQMRVSPEGAPEHPPGHKPNKE